MELGAVPVSSPRTPARLAGARGVPRHRELTRRSVAAPANR